MNEKSIDLVKDILKRKINAKHTHDSPHLTESDLDMLNIVCDNIYTLGVSEGMNRAFEVMRQAAKLPEEEGR